MVLILDVRFSKEIYIIDIDILLIFYRNDNVMVFKSFRQLPTRTLSIIVLAYFDLEIIIALDEHYVEKAQIN